MEAAGCTFIRMATASRFPQLRSSCEPNRFKTHRLIVFLVLALMAMGAETGAWARPAKNNVTVTLVETEAYTPCRDGCSATTEPARAFCFRTGDEYMVGDGRSYFHEDKFTSLEDLVGKQVPIRFKGHRVWIRPTDRATVRIHLGSLFENFKDNGCVREVHKPIIALAAHTRPRGKIPGDAIAIAGPDRGEFQPLYLWYACGLDGDDVACRRWYRNGEPTIGDWYCTRTADGAEIGAGFAIDPLLSRAGRLVLTSGAVLQVDGRERIDGKLEKPGEACF